MLAAATDEEEDWEQKLPDYRAKVTQMYSGTMCRPASSMRT